MKSKEELYFTWWLEELELKGFIESYNYEPKSFILFDPVKSEWIKKLKTKTKCNPYTLLQGHSYTPDFYIKWSESKLIELLSMGFIWNINESKKIGNVPSCNKLESWVDVKGSFNRFSGDREFAINQKYIYEKHGIYVSKIVPQKLFEKTFTPNRYLYTEKIKKPRKIKWEIKTI